MQLSIPFLPPDLLRLKFFPGASPLPFASFQLYWPLVPFGKHLARGVVWVEVLLLTSKWKQGAYFFQISLRYNSQSVRTSA